ncbi:Pogo transposable element with KRAB domain [Frankliniella fusca]|uniref:Pogo transposable element with KRAB domain n=1 Tax=Frankliniella fusca TaxID=407009 RepID=A0AAE1H1I4_9NEOP|nr:Pogo transposable element with KRAB domain [Frankliniella fusca]
MGFGLDTVQVRELAFQMAKKNSVKYPSTWDEEEKAGVEWLFGFRQRHPELTMRKPEQCSVDRAAAFTPENMKTFFGNLKNAVDRHPSFADGSRVYNLDEIGTTTVGSVKRKILAPTGVKQVYQSKTGERGTLVTTLCIIGANGSALPPVMVFPRVNFQPHMLINAYPGTLGLAAPSGWMNSDLFPEVMRHFVAKTGSSKQNPTLLIMDNDPAHLAIDAINIAKDNGVTVLTLSPHTSHKTQPLDVSVFSPFRNYYDGAMRNWITSNPGKNVTIYHIASFVNVAMGKAMTPATILSGFRKCGIFPYNPDVFTEADYLSASPFRATEEEVQQVEAGTVPETAAVTTSAATSGEDSTALLSQEVAVAAPPPPTVGDTTPGPSTSTFLGPHAIRGLPHKTADPKPARTTKSRKGRSMIPTDTPEKLLLEARKKAADEKKAAAEARKAAAAARKAAPGASKRPTDKTKSTRRACIPPKKRKKSQPSPSTSDEDEDDPLPLADSDASETWAEEESDDDGLPVVDPDALDKLEREPQEEDYVLMKIRTPTGNKKKQKITFKIGKVISSSDEHNNVTVSLLKKSVRDKAKFLLCDPVKIENVNVKKVIVMILPKPKLAGTKRQQFHLSFNVDLSLVPFEE